MNQVKKYYKTMLCKVSITLSIVGLVMVLGGCGDKSEVIYLEKSVYEPAKGTNTQTGDNVTENKENIESIEPITGSSEEKTPDSVAPQQEDERVDTAIEIEADYCKLYFPEEYEDCFTVKYSETAGYKAEFYGVIDGKKELHLFDVCFNSDDGDLLGYLENGDEIVNISIAMMELDFEGKWKQDEMDLMYSLQEEMNFVVETLSKNANYVEP